MLEPGNTSAPVRSEMAVARQHGAFMEKDLQFSEIMSQLLDSDDSHLNGTTSTDWY